MEFGIEQYPVRKEIWQLEKFWEKNKKIFKEKSIEQLHCVPKL